MRAIWIDATAQTVVEIDIEASLSGATKAMQQAVGGHIATVLGLPDGDLLHVNEIGPLRSRSDGWFFFKGEHPFIGHSNGIITGGDSDGWQPAKATLAWVRSHVRFMRESELRERGSRA